MARSDDIRALFVRALTAPMNLLPAVGMIGVGIAFGLWYLFPVAVVWYGVSAVRTIRSPEEARRVLAARRGAPAAIEQAPPIVLNDPEVRGLYEDARLEQARLIQEIDRSPVELPEVTTELLGMNGDVVTLCRQADRLSAYLADVDVEDLRRREAEAASRRREATSPELSESLARTESAIADQIALTEELAELRERVTAEAQSVVSTLGAIRAEVVRLGVSADDTDGAGDRLRERVGSTREDMRRLSAAIDEKARGAQGDLPAGGAASRA